MLGTEVMLVDEMARVVGGTLGIIYTNLVLLPLNVVSFPSSSSLSALSILGPQIISHAT